MTRSTCRRRNRLLVTWALDASLLPVLLTSQFRFPMGRFRTYLALLMLTSLSLSACGQSGPAGGPTASPEDQKGQNILVKSGCTRCQRRTEQGCHRTRLSAGQGHAQGCAASVGCDQRVFPPGTERMGPLVQPATALLRTGLEEVAKDSYPVGSRSHAVGLLQLSLQARRPNWGPPESARPLPAQG